MSFDRPRFDPTAASRRFEERMHDEFSPVAGGPSHRLLDRVGMATRDARGIRRASFIASVSVVIVGILYFCPWSPEARSDRQSIYAHHMLLRVGDASTSR